MWLKILTAIAICCPVYNEKIAILILARGGSKGLRLKNLQKIGGLSLVSRAISTAKAAGIQDITVSTDHPLIAFQAIRDNASAFRRSSVTATDWAPSIWGVAEFLESRPDVTVLLLMQATSPFTQPVHLRRAVRQINHPISYDCIFAATRSFKLRWNLVKGKLYPANFKLGARVRRQDWKGEFLETGAFYITRRWLLEEGQFQNDNCSVFEVSNIESLEVDTLEDLQIANCLHSAYNNYNIV